MRVVEPPVQADFAERARAVWAAYQRDCDVAHLNGQAVGIDPDTGEVFFGTSSRDITDRLTAEGRFRVLYVIRVGQDFYGRHPRLRRV